MFGSLRFILALMVLFSHTLDSSSKNFHYGVTAVVGFYIVSGYLMTYILNIKYSLKLRNFKAYYLDRFIRIFPLYLFYLLLMMALYAFINKDLLIITPVRLISNLTIIPLNFFDYINVGMLARTVGSNLEPVSVPLIPPAWSLAIETQFYLLIPFLLILPIRKLLLVGSMLLFAYAGMFSNMADRYTYRLLPGIIFTFLSGSLIYDLKFGGLENKKISCLFSVLSYLSFFVITLIFFLNNNLSTGFNKEIVLGYLVLLPIVYLLSLISKRNAIDDLLGNLSYGIFLGHFFAIRLFDLLQYKFTGILFSRLWFVLIFTILLSVITYWVIEQPFDRIRKGLAVAR